MTSVNDMKSRHVKTKIFTFCVANLYSKIELNYPVLAEQRTEETITIENTIWKLKNSLIIHKENLKEVHF